MAFVAAPAGLGARAAPALPRSSAARRRPATAAAGPPTMVACRPPRAYGRRGAPGWRPASAGPSAPWAAARHRSAAAARARAAAASVCLLPALMPGMWSLALGATCTPAAVAAAAGAPTRVVDAPPWCPRAEREDTPAAYVWRVELPGVAADSVGLRLLPDARVLVVAGDKGRPGPAPGDAVDADGAVRVGTPDAAGDAKAAAETPTPAAGAAATVDADVGVAPAAAADAGATRGGAPAPTRRSVRGNVQYGRFRVSLRLPADADGAAAAAATATLAAGVLTVAVRRVPPPAVEAPVEIPIL